MKINYSNENKSATADSVAAALEIIAVAAGVSPETLVTDDAGDRVLVWLSEEESVNDDGAKAYAEIR